jgi:anthranilate synthase component 2
VSKPIVLIDNFDSFSYNLVDYCFRAGVAVQVIRNDKSLEELKSLNPAALILSPGPERPEKAGNLMRMLDWYFDRVPILGICLGHQALGQLCGSAIIKAAKPMHGKISHLEVLSRDTLLFRGISKYEIVRYHSLVIDKVPADFQLTGIAREDKAIMAMAHRYLPIHSMQFHPEAALTGDGLRMIRNWIASVAAMVS